MSATVQCSRCHNSGPALDRGPMPPPLGDEILARVCSDCWAEWLSMEVIVINELRLNFMDPKSQEVIGQQLREFLQLGEEKGAGDGAS